jgi:hypothetical protein
MANNHTALQSADIDNLVKARDWIKGHFTEHREEKYSSVDGKLRALRAILESNWVEPHETRKLQSLGVAFGDAIAQRLMMDWVVVEDEYGRDPALNWPGTEIYVYPITMISKRVEDGDIPDIDELFAGICDRVSQMAFSGESQ